MPEAPITTVGTTRKVLCERTFQVELPNGKIIIGHLPRLLAGLSSSVTPGTRLHLELTPYDFEKARIAGLVDDA